MLAAVSRMKDLQSMAVRPDAVGAILVGKTPSSEFLTPSEFGQRLGSEIVGVVPATATPVPALLLGLVILLLAGNLLAALPGTLAARTSTAAVLRAE